MVKLHIISSRRRIKNGRVCGRLKDLHDYAFTIVELLIVIVVIGILAAITIISYRGITQRATEATLQADLSNASKKIKLYFADHGVYPTTMDPDGNGNYCPTGPVDNNYCIKPSIGGAFSYSLLSGGQDFSLVSKKGSLAYKITKDTVPTLTLIAESFVNTWGSNGTDVGNGIVQSGDGGYVITGYTTGFGAGGADEFLAKYNAAGSLEWNKTFGGSSDDVGGSIIKTNDGGYAVVGYTLSFGAGGQDLFLCKYDSNGNIIWNKTWGGLYIDYGYDLVQSNDGGYVITGWTDSFGTGYSDLILVKFNNSGDVMWNKTWGGTSSEYGESLVQTSDGGYAVTGFGSGYGAGSSDLLLLKFDSGGNMSWAKTWGSNGYEYGEGVSQTSDGGYVVTGNSENFGAGVRDMVLVKFDSSGNLVWNKTWGGAGADYGYEVIQSNDNTYVVSGWTNSFGAGGGDIFLNKYDINGNIIWNRTWGSAGNDDTKAYRHLFQTNDNGYALIGRTDSYGAGGEVFVTKYKSDGLINGCISPMCQSPSATVTTPSATITTPSASVTSPSATITTPSATVTSPSVMTTTVVAP